MSLTAERLRAQVRFDPESGHFSRTVALRGGRVGPLNLSPHKNGYLYISIDGTRYLAHRLAWLYVHGEWPAGQIDHMNGDRIDNRLANLRVVSNAINQQNVRRARVDNRSSGVLGVSRLRGKWRARIWLDGRERHLGVFDWMSDAHAAYLKAKRSLHVGCTI